MAYNIAMEASIRIINMVERRNTIGTLLREKWFIFQLIFEI